MDKPPPNPKIEKFHLGIYAVIEQGHQILLVRKSRGPYQNSWDLPGGRPIHGETILQTLQREVKEETGVEIIEIDPLINKAFVVEYQKEGELISLHHTCLIYKATQYISLKFQNDIRDEDVAGCAWIDRSQLAALALSKVVLCVL